MFWTTIQNIWRLQIILTTVFCGSEKVKGVTMAFLEQGPNQGSQVERGKRVVLSGGQNLWHLCPAAMFLSPKARFGVWQTASNYMGHRSKLGPFKLKDFSPNFRVQIECEPQQLAFWHWPTDTRLYFHWFIISVRSIQYSMKVRKIVHRGPKIIPFDWHRIFRRDQSRSFCWPLGIPFKVRKIVRGLDNGVSLLSFSEHLIYADIIFHRLKAIYRFSGPKSSTKVHFF